MIFVTLIVDVVAMIRHIPMWFGHAGAAELLVLMFGLFIIALLFSFSIRYSVRDIQLEAGSWKKVVIFFIIAIAVLLLYPEFLIQSIIGELFTLFAGILILFFLLSVLPEVFIPFDVESFNSSETQRHQTSKRMELLLVALLGIGAGIVLLFGQWNGEGAPAPEHRIMIASIFVGVPLISLIIAYYCLRKPLALFRY